MLRENETLVELSRYLASAAAAEQEMPPLPRVAWPSIGRTPSFLVFWMPSR